MIYRGWDFKPYNCWLRCGTKLGSVDVTFDVYDDYVYPNDVDVFVSIMNKSTGLSVKFTIDTSELVHRDELVTPTTDSELHSALESLVNLFKHEEITSLDNKKRSVLSVGEKE